MAILGTLIDRTLSTRALDDLALTALGGVNLTLTTLAHSLPATNPEALIMQLRSMGEGIAFAEPILLGLGGNASLSTIGFAAGGVSQNTIPTVAFTAWAIVFHSVIR